MVITFMNNLILRLYGTGIDCMSDSACAFYVRKYVRTRNDSTKIAGNNNNTKACNGPRTAAACTCVGPLRSAGDQRVFLFQKWAENAEGRPRRRGKHPGVSRESGREPVRLCVRRAVWTALNRAAAQHCRPGASAFLLSRSQAYTWACACYVYVLLDIRNAIARRHVHGRGSLYIAPACAYAQL
jgi:hypothetical protein